MNFLEAWYKSQRLKENSNHAALLAVVTGLNVAEDFWDNFILVCNNKEGMAELLNVSPEKIASWPAIIKTNLDKAKTHNFDEEDPKTKIMDTGEREEGS